MTTIPERKYLVRQSRPAYFSGFTTQVGRGVAYDEITSMPWCNNFKHDDFTHFSIAPYTDDELIISAHYANGEHWVVGFALPEDSTTMAPDGGLLRDNWRYKEHES